MSPVRKVSGLLRAERCAPRLLPKPKTPAGRKGLAYQRKVGKELKELALVIGGKLESEPWFLFFDKYGLGRAVPDFVLRVDKLTLVIEVKLTWTPEAELKLLRLYLPVVTKALVPFRIRGLLICRNLTRELNTNYLVPSILKAREGEPNVLQWLGTEPMPW